MFLKRTALFINLFPILFFCGCATVPMARMDDDVLAKKFIPQNNKSSIYLYRNESLGGAILITVALDGKIAGQTGPQTFFLWEVDPGAHEISSMAENVSKLALTTDPGKAYYVWQEIKMGMWMPRSVLQEVDAATGQVGVSECKRAQSNL